MEENVKVSISGKQEALDGEAMEIVTTGQYKVKDGKVYLSYIDNVLDEENPIKTLIKTDGDLVSIFRYGKNNSHLLFERGVSHIVPYETPFGSFEMISHTKDVDLKPLEGGFELTVDYQVELNRSKVGRNLLHVVATPLKK
ncbi:MAG: DUF1934 domain-containing protein [Eubacteriales bacterium]|nr:DUF1934 domain-containing protein [Eubacteriales bacterium]